MDVPWPTGTSSQTESHIAVGLCVTQHLDHTPQVVFHLIGLFYPLGLWVVIIVTIMR